MKICFVAWNPFGAGGISRVVSLLASELSKEHDISILCLKRNPGNYYNMDLSKEKYSYESKFIVDMFVAIGSGCLLWLLTI